MCPVIKEIKKRLRKAGFANLTVQRGRGTGYSWLGIRRPDNLMLSKEEMRIAHEIFGEKPGPGGGSNVYLIIDSVAEMKLGMTPRKPVCELCGTTYEKQAHADNCRLGH